jgi:hypothetical protein
MGGTMLIAPSHHAYSNVRTAMLQLPSASKIIVATDTMSISVQKYLLSNGYTWDDQTNDVIIGAFPYLYVYGNEITWDTDAQLFHNAKATHMVAQFKPVGSCIGLVVIELLPVDHLQIYGVQFSSSYQPPKPEVTPDEVVSEKFTYFT